MDNKKSNKPVELKDFRITTVIYKEEKSESFTKRIATSFKHNFSKLENKLNDTLLWKYNPFWEIDNEELYRSKDYYETEEFIIEQKFIPASSISWKFHSFLNESDFPWHGHTLEDFLNLNKSLQDCIPIVKAIKTPSDVKAFRSKHRVIYDAYFQRPLLVMKEDDGTYDFYRDGRHRIYAATITNSVLPVWVIEEKDPNSVDIEYFKKHYAWGTWRFLGEL